MNRPELEIWWAFNAASRTRTWRRLVPPFTWRTETGNLRITEAESRHPYGRSSHASAYLTHLVAAIYLAWRNGQLVAAYARWRCGAGTRKFRLIDEPESVVCPACTIERIGRPDYEPTNSQSSARMSSSVGV